MIDTSKVNKELTIQSFSTTPFEEGWARIERAVHGVDLAQIDLPSLPLTERIVDLLTGIALCMPIINAILWIFIYYIGNAESFSTNEPELPFVAWQEAEEAAKKKPLVFTPSVVTSLASIPNRTEEYSTTDQEKSAPAYEVKVTIEYYPNFIIVKNTTPKLEKYTECVYDAKWSLKSIKHTDDGKNLNFTLIKEGSTLLLSGTHDEDELDQIFELPDPKIPWMQQFSQGIRPFVKSGKSETQFYAFDPQDFSIALGKLTRRNCFIHQKHGSVVEVGLSAASGIKSWLGDVRISLHNLKSGLQFQETWDVPFFYSSSSTVNDVTPIDSIPIPS